jgi:hypothetical protein
MSGLHPPPFKTLNWPEYDKALIRPDQKIAR